VVRRAEIVRRDSGPLHSVRQLHPGLSRQDRHSRLILELRRRSRREGQTFTQKAIFSVVNNRRLFHSMLRTASRGAEAYAEGRIHSSSAILPFGYDRIPQPAAIADVPSVTSSSRCADKAEEKAAFYSGCLIDFAYPRW